MAEVSGPSDEDGPITFQQAWSDSSKVSAAAWNAAMMELRRNHRTEFIALLNEHRALRGLVPLNLVPPGGRRVMRRENGQA